MKLRHITYLVVTAVLWLLHSGLAAQTDDVAKQINQIKRDKQYLFAESTAETWQEAYDYSLSQLLLYVNIERTALELESLTNSMLVPLAKHLSMPRGPMQRVLVYASREDLSLPVEQEASATDTINIIVPLSSVDLMGSQPAAPQIIVGVDSISHRDMEYVLASFCLAETTTEAGLLLQSFQKEGDVLDYGRLLDKNSVEVGQYLIVFDAKRTLRTLLHVREEGIYNIKLQQFDSLDNYPDCAFVWFK